MAEKSGATGILKGIQNVLILRRQNRMAEAKQELQGVKFKMLQRQMDLREEEHKSAQAFRKAQMEKDKYIKTDRGWMDITSGKIMEGTEPQMSASDALRQQEAGFKSRAMNILSDPNSTPEQKRWAEAQFSMTPQRPISVSPGGTLVDPTTGESMFTAPPPQRPISVAPGSTLVDPTTGESMFTAPPPQRPISVAPGSTLVDPTTGESMFTAPPRERPISVAPGSTLVDPTTGESMFTAPPRERPPTALIRDFDVLMKPIPKGISPELKKVYEQREKAILSKYDIDKKKTSAFKEKLDILKQFGPPSEEQILTLIGVYGRKRQPTPKLMAVSESVNFLTNIAMMLTGKNENNGADAVKELKNHPEKYLEAFTEQAHLIGRGMSKEGIPTFYGYASQMIGQTINPEGAAKAITQPKAVPEQLAPPQSWQEVVDRGQPITDEEYQALKKVFGTDVPDELIDAIAELHLWEE